MKRISSSEYFFETLYLEEIRVSREREKPEEQLSTKSAEAVLYFTILPALLFALTSLHMGVEGKTDATYWKGLRNAERLRGTTTAKGACIFSRHSWTIIPPASDKLEAGENEQKDPPCLAHLHTRERPGVAAP